MIYVTLERLMVERGIGLTELATRIELTQANLSILKNNKGKAIRFSTLEALCRELNCQPGDLITFIPDQENLEEERQEEEDA